MAATSPLAETAKLAFVLTNSVAAAPILAASSGLSTIVSRMFAVRSTSAKSARKPVTPSSTRSAVAPAWIEATHGSPAAMASTSTSPQMSYSDGKTKQRARAR